MVTGVGVGDLRILSTCFPVEFAGVHDYAAKRCAVTADEFGGGMNHDVSPVLDGSYQIRRAECVVYYDGDAVPVRDLGNGVDIRNVAVGVAECFNEYRLGVRLDRRLCFLKIVYVDKGGCDTVMGEGVGKQVVAAAVYRFLCYYVISLLGKCFYCVRDRGGA